MPRRHTELVEEALHVADEIARCVSTEYPNADGEWTENRVKNVVQLYNTLKLCDAIDDLAEIVRNYTP